MDSIELTISKIANGFVVQGVRDTGPFGNGNTTLPVYFSSLSEVINGLPAIIRDTYDLSYPEPTPRPDTSQEDLFTVR